MLNFGKNLLITSDNQKKNVHYINLLKLIPKMKSEKKFKYKQPIFKSRNAKMFYCQKTQNESKNENDESQTQNKISQINMSTLNENNLKESLSPKNNKKLNINDIQMINTKINYLGKNNTQKSNKNLHKDRVFAFFNRNFYECDIPISKKTELNQKILNYFLQDKEHKEKMRRLRLEEIMTKKNRYNTLKNIFNSQTKRDIKQSLILNDFTIYHKIHKVVRFWGKFANYACPIFQVQKFSLSSKKYKEEKLDFSLDNNFEKSYSNQKNNNDKNIRLPILYTNSSKTIEKMGNKKYKFLSKNRSDLDINELSSNNVRLLNIKK